MYSWQQHPQRFTILSKGEWLYLWWIPRTSNPKAGFFNMESAVSSILTPPAAIFSCRLSDKLSYPYPFALGLTRLFGVTQYLRAILVH